MQHRKRYFTPQKEGDDYGRTAAMVPLYKAAIPATVHNRMVETLEEAGIPVTYTDSIGGLPEETPAITFSAVIFADTAARAQKYCFLVSLFYGQSEGDYRAKLLGALGRNHYPAVFLWDKRILDTGLRIASFAVADTTPDTSTIHGSLRWATDGIVPERSAAAWAM